MSEFHTRAAGHRHHRAAPDVPPPMPDQPHPCPPELRDEAAQRRTHVLTVACPHCHARPGVHCTVASTGTELPAGHPARIELAFA